MGYTVLRGSFVIRYPDLPRQGPQPDGDTVKFKPDTPALVDTLPRRSGRPAQINSRGISVRLEAIDALETHFDDDHQELAGATAARDALLAQLGFTGVTFFPDAPNNVDHADQDSVRGHVLSNGIDANGRMIGFIYPGDPVEPDGAQVFLDNPRVDTSINATLLTAGLTYPAFYDTLPADLRAHLADVSRAARAAGAGIWPRSTADPNGAGDDPGSRGAGGVGDLAQTVPPHRPLPRGRVHRLRRLRHLAPRGPGQPRRRAAAARRPGPAREPARRHHRRRAHRAAHRVARGVRHRPGPRTSRARTPGPTRTPPATSSSWPRCPTPPGSTAATKPSP